MDILLLILKLIIMIVVPAAVSAGTYFIKKYIEKFLEQIEDEKTKRAILDAVDVIEQSVMYVQQTYVDSLKNNKEFTLESQKEALEKAKDRAIELMNSKMFDAIYYTYGDLNLFIETIIESTIQKNK